MGRGAIEPLHVNDRQHMLPMLHVRSSVARCDAGAGKKAALIQRGFPQGRSTIGSVLATKTIASKASWSCTGLQKYQAYGGE